MSGNNPADGQPGPNEAGPYGSSQPNPGSGFGQPSGPAYGGPGGYPGQPNPYGPGPQGPGQQAPGQQGPGQQGPGQPWPGGPGQPMGPGGPGQPMGPGGPGGPYGPGGQPPYGSVPPGGKKSNSRLLIIIGAAVLALIILGIGAGVLINNRNKTVATDPTDPNNPQSSAPAATKPSDAVKAYLDALAAGQAATALSLGVDQPADKTFLTDAVLADSNKRAPITEINVPEVTDEYTYSVDASYKMGDQAVTDKYNVKKVGDSWKVQDTFAELNLTYARAKTLPMLINTVAVKTDKVRVFPGSYTFTSGNKYVNYGDEGTLLLTSPSEYPSLSDIKPTLSQAGETAFVAAIKTQVTACVKQKKLAPSGCPFGIKAADYQKFDEDTIEWKLDDGVFDNIKPRLDYENPAIVEASGSIPVIFSAEGEQFGDKAKFGPQKVSGYASMSANLTKEPIKVVFTR
ncbi:MAG: hypothetical protein ABWY56_12495 [Propionibacteriaceae bacterium]